MKTKFFLTLATAALLMNGGLSVGDAPRLSMLGGAEARAGVFIDIGFFYDRLSPHGRWRQVSPYGWVWYPRVAIDWRPYSIGYWAFADDYGWTWISQEPWGSIPFHYGRWFHDDDYGWAWVPGTDWAPAWVTWRSGGGYIGWAPLPPTVDFWPGRGFSRDSYYWERDIRPHYWCFVREPEFVNPRLEQVIVPRPRVVNVFNETVNVTNYTVFNNRVVNRSIDVNRFEQDTQRRVVRYRVNDVDQPVTLSNQVRGNQIAVFRPQVLKPSANAAPPASAIMPPRTTTPRADTPTEQRSAPINLGTATRRQDGVNESANAPVERKGVGPQTWSTNRPTANPEEAGRPQRPDTFEQSRPEVGRRPFNQSPAEQAGPQTLPPSRQPGFEQARPQVNPRSFNRPGVDGEPGETRGVPQPFNRSPDEQARPQTSPQPFSRSAEPVRPQVSPRPFNQQPVEQTRPRNTPSPQFGPHRLREPQAADTPDIQRQNQLEAERSRQRAMQEQVQRQRMDMERSRLEQARQQQEMQEQRARQQQMEAERSRQQAMQEQARRQQMEADQSRRQIMQEQVQRQRMDVERSRQQQMEGERSRQQAMQEQARRQGMEAERSRQQQAVQQQQVQQQQLMRQQRLQQSQPQQDTRQTPFETNRMRPQSSEGMQQQRLSPFGR